MINGQLQGLMSIFEIEKAQKKVCLEFFFLSLNFFMFYLEIFC